MSDIRWCTDNAQGLSLSVFANHFGYADKNTANARYSNVLNSKGMSQVPNLKELRLSFETWMGSTNEADFWREVALSQARQDTRASLTASALNTMKRLGEEESERISRRRRVCSDGHNAGNKDVCTHDNSGGEDQADTRAGEPVAPVALITSDENWIDDEDLFWDAWRDLMAREEAVHDYDLQNYGVIECGYAIECRSDVTQELYEHLGLTKRTTTIIQQHQTYIRQCYAARRISAAAFLLSAKDTSSLDTTTESASLVSDIFFQFAKHVFLKDGNNIDKYESTYNHRAIWPCIEAAVDSVSCEGLKFLTGEIYLKAFKELGVNYSADGIIFDAGQEVALLETSGPYNLNDRPRFAYDHVKGTLGLLAMFRATVEKYYFATLEAFSELKMFFIHSRGTTIHLWALEMPSTNVFVLERIAKAEVPSGTTTGHMLSEVVNLFWLLKLGIENVHNVIKMLHDSHDQYLEHLTLDEVTEDNRRPDLRELIATKVVKPKHGPGYRDLLPKSFLDL